MAADVSLEKPAEPEKKAAPPEAPKTYTYKDVDIYLKNASDKIEVSIQAGNYYEDYVAEHVKNHQHETKILATLATHFRSQGFRVKIYQSDAAGFAGKKFSFLRIAWNYNPYHYPEEKPSSMSRLFSFLPLGKKPERPRLFDAGEEAYKRVKAQDTLTGEAIKRLEKLVGEAMVREGHHITVKKHELKALLKEVAPREPLHKLDTREIIRHFEKKGLRVTVTRMFQFEMSMGARRSQ
ncbi:MAG: hypothetical protein IJ849_06930 [Selenomonadaceae bacterium]|nr:hypothetical protein [Selenomonadaceae bacterium]